MFFWRKARSENEPEPVTVLVPPNWVETLDGTPIDTWEPPEDPPREATAQEHIRIIVRSLQEAARTGFVPGWYITRIYPELAWMSNVKPLAPRQLVIALTAHLTKKKKRTATGSLLTHYLVPEPTEPEMERNETVPEQDVELRGQVVAFASKRERAPGGKRARRRRKGELSAAA